MTETLSFTKTQKDLNHENASFEAENDIKKRERKKSINSSNPESSFNKLNSEIKPIIENETELSFSINSSSDLEEKKSKYRSPF